MMPKKINETKDKSFFKINNLKLKKTKKNDDSDEDECISSEEEESSEDLFGSADETESPNLLSNTNPNVMYSATVQGETGLAPFLVLFVMLIGVFNVFIWLK